MKIISLILFSLMTSNVAFAQNVDVKTRLKNALKTLDSLQVNFEQTVVNEKKQAIQQSTGNLAILRPNKFNWTYLTPYEQQIIADGKEIWVYDVDLMQASVKPMDATLGNTPIMVLMNSKSLEEDFNISELGQKRYLYWIELTPKKENEQFEIIYFGLKDNEIMAMDLRDTFGQSTQIAFKNHRYNVIHNPKIFQFEPSDDIDIYSGR